MTAKKIQIITMQMYAERLGVSYQQIRQAYRLYTNQELDAPPWVRRIERALAPPNAVIGVHPLWLSTEIEEFEKDNPPKQLLNEDPRRWRYGTDETLCLVDEKWLEAVARKVLKDRERSVFFRRYMLDGNAFHTRRQLAEEYGISSEWVRRLQISAEQKVRQVLNEDDP